MPGRSLLWLAMLAAGAAEAADGPPRISIGAIRGERRGAISRQLSAALCGGFECVPRSRVFRRGLPDFGRARRADVKGFLLGHVTRERGARVLVLALATESLTADVAWRFRLRRDGTLPAPALEEVERELRARLLPPPPPPPPPLERPPPPPPPPAPAPPPPLAVPLPPPPAAPAPEPPGRREAARPAPVAPEAAGERAQHAAAVELGVFVSGRDLGYEGLPATGGGLATYRVDAMIAPRARLELFPLSLLGDGPFAGLGLFGDYRLSVGLKTQAAGAAERSSSYSRLSGGLAWRIRPAASSRLALIPAVSYERLTFTTEVAAGAPVPGLPDAHLRGFRGGLGAEIPLGGRFAILLGAGYVRWTGARDLVGGFFPGGSAWALEAEAGLSAAISRLLSIRLLGEYSSTRYRLDPDPTGTYSATGATESYLGGRAMLRLEL